MEQTVVYFCTCPSPDSATDLANTLVTEKLAACVNIVPAISSIYEWQGELCRDQEALLIIKTTQGKFNALEKRVTEQHPYDVPELIGFDVSNGHPPYINWLISTIHERI
ncbi:MAG: divalent-cation tolerance protein CutA [Kangiellaceae bacterium]|jgi:periplasmic divalent cation tolerance protein|nr:divalent-cation tolerance protein CutA [Kangiellaceae bacterium]